MLGKSASNLSIISRDKILYVSTQRVSFQSVAIVRKHPGRVVNRNKSALTAWRALTKVGAKWKISTHWYTPYPLERKLTSYKLQNGNSPTVCVGGGNKSQPLTRTHRQITDGKNFAADVEKK